MRAAVICLFLSLHPTLLPAAEKLDERIAKIINAPEYKQATWGILIVDPATGKEIYNLNGDKLFAPASTTKLFSCATALAELGPDHRFETRVYQRGLAIGGVLNGDLILVASGDPTMGGRNTRDCKLAFRNNDHTYANSPLLNGELTDTDPLFGLDELAKQIAARGIKEIGGEILIDDRLFERSSSSGSGPNVVSSIIINDNVVDVIVTPGYAEGDAAKVTIRPETAAVQMDNEIVTIGEKGKAEIGISGDGPGRFRVRGRIPLHSPPKLVIYGIEDPANFARTLFIECLRKRGIRVDAGKFQPHGDLPRKNGYDRLLEVASFKSLPFSEVIKVTLKVSHNLYASTLPLLVAAKNGDESLAYGLKRQGRFLKELGVETSTISFAGGAGGMIADEITPAAGIQLLKGMTKHPVAQAYFDALPVLGVDGTLEEAVKADSPAKAKVRAKTGTLVYYDVMNDRFLLRSKALVGDIETHSGKKLLFAMFVNNVPLAKGVQTSREGKTLGKICEAIYESAD